MTDDSPSAYVSRPFVLINGTVNEFVSQCVLAALVEETIDGLFRCEMVLNNFGEGEASQFDYLFFKRDLLDFGNEIGLRLGPTSPPTKVFSGRITALEAEYPVGGGARIVVLAEDRLQDLRMTRRTRSFEDVSDEDVIDQIARDHGLSTQLDISGPTYRSLAQVNLSDLAFIRERARPYDGDVWIEDGVLYVQSRGGRSEGEIKLGYGANLQAFNVRADLAQQCTELVVSGWDVEQKDAIRESADNSILQAELEQTISGSAILEQAFGMRAASLVHSIPLNSEEAKQAARGRYLDRARRFVTGSGLADGDARLRAGSTVTLSGLGTMFNGKYYVTRVRHTYTLATGFRSEFDVERPGIGR
jgi:uncharacterized protein